MSENQSKTADRSIKAIVFDMDGLMVDSEPLARQVWERVLAEYGHELDDQTHHQMVGRRTDESARIVLDVFPLPFTPAELVAHKTAIWEEQWRAQGPPPLPGLRELQSELARRELSWAVATSSPRHYAEHVLQELGCEDACQSVTGGDEVEHGKPAPDIYLLAAERLGVAPENCLALEDSVPGARAAQAAGMTVVAVPGVAGAREQFAFADYCFSSLHDVLAHLDELLRDSH